MCVLEMITREVPYQECNGSYSRTRAKILSHQPPKCLEKVGSPVAVKFIQTCLVMNVTERPSASELLTHPFLKETPADDEEIVLKGTYCSEVLIRLKCSPYIFQISSLLKQVKMMVFRL